MKTRRSRWDNTSPIMHNNNYSLGNGIKRGRRVNRGVAGRIRDGGKKMAAPKKRRTWSAGGGPVMYFPAGPVGGPARKDKWGAEADATPGGVSAILRARAEENVQDKVNQAANDAQTQIDNAEQTARINAEARGITYNPGANYKGAAVKAGAQSVARDMAEDNNFQRLARVEELDQSARRIGLDKSRLNLSSSNSDAANALARDQFNFGKEKYTDSLYGKIAENEGYNENLSAQDVFSGKKGNPAASTASTTNTTNTRGQLQNEEAQWLKKNALIRSNRHKARVGRRAVDATSAALSFF